MREKIKTMKLYSSVDRVYRELDALGKLNASNLDPEELSKFDQLHYHGIEAVDYAIKRLKIGELSRVLEIGSGVGGPARYIASKTGAKVTALELQKDHHSVGEDLTKRCGLDHLINHIQGDFLDFKVIGEKFDAVVSWLSIYHISERTKLLDIALNALTPGGYFYTEDFALHSSLSSSEQQQLKENFFANYLVSYHKFEKDFDSSKFDVVEVVDTTKSWANFTKARYHQYLSNMDRNISVHGREVVDNMLFFYAFAMKLLQANKLGGIRLIAKKI